MGSLKSLQHIHDGFAILQGVMVTLNSGTCGYTLICRMTLLPLSVCGSSSEQGSGHVDGTVRPL